MNFKTIYSQVHVNKNVASLMDSKISHQQLVHTK